MLLKKKKKAGSWSLFLWNRKHNHGCFCYFWWRPGCPTAKFAGSSCSVMNELQWATEACVQTKQLFISTLLKGCTGAVCIDVWNTTRLANLPLHVLSVSHCFTLHVLSISHCFTLRVLSISHCFTLQALFISYFFTLQALLTLALT